MRIKHKSGEAFIPASYMVQCVNRRDNKYRDSRKMVKNYTVEVTFNHEGSLYMNFKSAAKADAAYKKICKRVKGDY